MPTPPKSQPCHSGFSVSFGLRLVWFCSHILEIADFIHLNYQ